MLYELRIYHCVPGRLPDLLKRFDTITLNIWKRHGIEQAGFWSRSRAWHSEFKSANSSR